MCTCVHGADDWCWHAPFAFWVYGNGLTRLRHNFHIRMHPLWATQHPTDGLVWGRFGKDALDRNDTLGSAPLSMDLMIGAGMLHLPCGCMSLNRHAWGMSCMPGCIPFRLHSAQQMGWFWADLAKLHRTEVMQCGVCLCPCS